MSLPLLIAGSLRDTSDALDYPYLMALLVSNYAPCLGC